MSTEVAEPPLDLRLAMPALVGWLAVLWGLGRSWSVTLAVAGLAGTGTLALALARRYGFALCCCVIAVLLTPLSVRLHAAHASPLARLARSNVAVTAEVVVSGDPRPLAAHGVAGAPRSAVDASIRTVVIAGRRTSVSGSVLVLGPADAWRGVLPGQRVRLDGQLQPPLAGDLLTAVISEQTDPELMGRPPPWQRAAGAVRSGLQRASVGLPSLPRGLLPGLVDGDTSQLDPVLENRFRTAGLTHLVAVSGTNCSIIVGVVALLLRRLRASPRATAVIGFGVLLGFVIIARPSPSVLRAAVMAGIALIALATGRQRSALPALAATIIVLLLWQPGLAADLGFTLSVAATAALLLIAPGWVKALRHRRVPSGLAEPIAVAAAAHLITVPLIAAISGRISLVAIPANVLAEPVVGVATVLGLLAALLSVVWLPSAELFADLAGWLCRWLVWVAEYFGTLPGASVPWPSGTGGGVLLAALAVGVWWLCRHPLPRGLVAVAVVVALAVQIPVRGLVSGWPPTGWLIVACDVGQGDSLALNAGPGAAVVIDAGPDPVAVDRCLRELGISRIPLLVLSHSHLDHVGGLSGVLHERRVGQVVTSPLNEPITGHRLVLNVLGAHGLALGQVSAGVVLTVSGIRLEVLGPRELYHDTRSDPNNSSVVLRATIDGIRILLPGDAEIEAQDDLLSAGTDLRADILKVPHHGSAYSDPAFLQAVHARIALITVGLHNDYGHPSPLLLAELTKLGVPARRTDLDGDIAVVDHVGQLTPVVHATQVDAAGLRPARSPPPPVGPA